MFRILLTGILLTMLPPAAFAEPVVYTINFTVTPGGTIPTSGSFVYDSNAVANGFTSFIVVWGHSTFDFTQAANSLNVGGVCPAIGSVGAFSILDHSISCGMSPDFIWSAFEHSDQATFRFVARSSPDFADLSDVIPRDGLAGTIGDGSWTLAQAETPEPDSALLWLAGLAALGWRSRKSARLT